jgi:hypothetical protein
VGGRPPTAEVVSGGRRGHPNILIGGGSGHPQPQLVVGWPLLRGFKFLFLFLFIIIIIILKKIERIENSEWLFS